MTFLFALSARPIWIYFSKLNLRQIFSLSFSKSISKIGRNALIFKSILKIYFTGLSIVWFLCHRENVDLGIHVQIEINLENLTVWKVQRQ